MNRWLLFIHLVGAAVWLGGMVTVGALVPAMRKAGAERAQIQAVARQFGRVSWVALGLTVGVGIIALIINPDLVSALPGFELKMGLVVAAAGLALWHQLAAGDQSPARRGMTQAAILVVTLGVYAVAAGW